MIEALFGALGAGLRLWEHEEKTKYLDQYVKLKEAWNAEINKSDADRDDDVLSNLSDQLRIFAYAWSQAAAQSNPGNKP